MISSCAIAPVLIVVESLSHSGFQVKSLIDHLSTSERPLLVSPIISFLRPSDASYTVMLLFPMASVVLPPPVCPTLI